MAAIDRIENAIENTDGLIAIRSTIDDDTLYVYDSASGAVVCTLKVEDNSASQNKFVQITPDADGEFTVSVPGKYSKLSGRAPMGATAVEIEEVINPEMTATPETHAALFYDEDGNFNADAAPITIPESRFSRFTGKANVPGTVVGVD